MPYEQLRIPVCLGLSALFGLMAWSIYRLERRNTYRVVHLLFRLGDGERHVPIFDRTLDEADFREEADRRQALRTIAGRLRRAEIAQASLWASDPLPGSATAWQLARKVWARQMHLGRLRPELVTPPGTLRIRPGDSCVLGILMAVPAVRVESVIRAGNAEQALDNLGGASPYALYVYYAPDPGQSLDTASAQRLFDRWSAAAGPQGRPLLGISRLVLALALTAIAVAALGTVSAGPVPQSTPGPRAPTRIIDAWSERPGARMEAPR